MSLLHRFRLRIAPQDFHLHRPRAELREGLLDLALGLVTFELDEEDVVRHRLVKAIIKAYDKEKQREETTNS